MNKKLFKRAISFAMSFIMAITLYVPAFASTTTFSLREEFGFSGRLYLTNKEEVPLRSEPHNKGLILETLPSNYPIESVGFYRTSKNTLWCKVVTYDYPEAWIFVGNLGDEHFHDYIDLDADYEGFSFCHECGHIRVATTATYSTITFEEAHLALAALSLIPVVGNGFDILDALLSAAEGDYLSASVALTAAVPTLGSAVNVIKAGKTATILDDVSDVTVIGKLVEGSDEFVEITTNLTPDYNKLRKSMKDRYLETLDDRFYDYSDYYLPNKSIAAHHIVPANASAVSEARDILRKVGIDIDSFENGVFLCSKTEFCENTAIHAGGHSKAYYETVNNAVKRAYKEALPGHEREAVVNELDKIARLLMNEDLKL